MKILPIASTSGGAFSASTRSTDASTGERGGTLKRAESLAIAAVNNAIAAAHRESPPSTLSNSGHSPSPTASPVAPSSEAKPVFTPVAPMSPAPQRVAKSSALLEEAPPLPPPRQPEDSGSFLRACASSPEIAAMAQTLQERDETIARLQAELENEKLKTKRLASALRGALQALQTGLTEYSTLITPPP